jgi:hypothetical protein
LLSVRSRNAQIQRQEQADIPSPLCSHKNYNFKKSFNDILKDIGNKN